MTTSIPQRFRISFEWKHREKKYDVPERPTSWPVAYLALAAFLDDYEGAFSLQFGDTEVEFDLDWDLPIIFEYIPQELEGLVRDEGVPYYVAFAEQGTAVGLGAVRSGQQLTVELEPIGDPPDYFRQFFGKQFHVSAAEFISEWVRFTSAVLDAVLEHDPSIKDDPEVKRYTERLEALRNAVKTGKVDLSALPQRAE